MRTVLLLVLMAGCAPKAPEPAPELSKGELVVPPPKPDMEPRKKWKRFRKEARKNCKPDNCEFTRFDP